MPEKTVSEKLMMKPGRRVSLVNAPENAAALLGSLPEGMQMLDPDAQADALAQAEIILLFAHHRIDLETLLPGLRTALAPNGMIWVAYHKGTSPVKTDINRDSIWAYARTIGLDAVAQVSINEDWSAMRLKRA